MNGKCLFFLQGNNPVSSISESAIFPTNGDVDEEGFIPKLAIPQAIAVLDDDDLDYMDRVNRLQHALKVKRSVVSEADGYSQNIRPIDLD
uniref:Uncharacterized protein n=1 Tax=Panagrolaimus sp. JU765 TaxID=591449 RepID=A0AC34RFH3_9BILA